MQRRARVTLGGEGHGLHQRPITRLTMMLQRYPHWRERTRIIFRRPEWTMRIENKIVSDSSWREFDPFSHISLLGLAAGPGEVFEVLCEGPDADEAFETLRTFLTGMDDYEGGLPGTVWEDLSES